MAAHVLHSLYYQRDSGTEAKTGRKIRSQYLTRQTGIRNHMALKTKEHKIEVSPQFDQQSCKLGSL